MALALGFRSAPRLDRPEMPHPGPPSPRAQANLKKSDIPATPPQKKVLTFVMTAIIMDFELRNRNGGQMPYLTDLAEGKVTICAHCFQYWTADSKLPHTCAGTSLTGPKLYVITFSLPTEPTKPTGTFTPQER